MEKDKQHANDRLEELIYNYELPEAWQSLEVHEKFHMFQKLFLLLSKEFQDQFCEELREWFKIFSDIEKNRDVSKHPWLKMGRDGGLLEKCYECIGYPSSFSCKMRFCPDEFYNLLNRRSGNSAFFSEVFEGRDIESSSNKLALCRPGVYDYRSFLSDPALGNEYIKPRDFAFFMATRFYTFSKAIQNGGITERIFPCVNLKLSKERIMKDFEAYIEERQDAYFKRFPEYRLLELGQRRLKEDGRAYSYPFDEWEQYFKAYVLKVYKKMKHRDIAKKIIPNNDDEPSAVSSISNYIKKAKILIRNAWENNFPDEKRKLY